MKRSLSIKRFIAMLLAVVLLVPVTYASVKAAGESFTDVAPDHWAYEYIERTVSEGLFKGVSDTKFGPEVTMSRGMFVTVLSRMAKVTVDDSVGGKFTDVPAGQYYTGSVNWAADAGIAKGTGNGAFSPDDDVTREQAATFLKNYADYMGLTLPTGAAKEFTDSASIGSYAVDAVRALTDAGIISGYTDGTFKPLNSITRAEAAKMFAVFMDTATGGGTGGEQEEPSTPTQPTQPTQPTPGGSFSGGGSGSGSGSGSSNRKWKVSFTTGHSSVTVDGAEVKSVLVKNGGSVTFTVTADEGYEIYSVMCSAGDLTDNGDGTYTVSNIRENVDVAVGDKETVYWTVDFKLDNATVLVDGKEVESVTVRDGSDLTFTAVPKEGYEIASVEAAPAKATANGDGSYTISGITADELVSVAAAEKAQQVESYTVTFVTDEGVEVYVDGEAVTSGTVTSDSSFFMFTTKLTQDHTKVTNATATPSGELNSTGETWILTGFTGDVTVTLTTGPETFEVRFVTGEGASQVETQTVEYNGTATRPTDPTLEGKHFGGWYTEDSYINEYDFDTKVTGNTALYALWLGEVDTVHVSGSGNNRNDGGSAQTSVMTIGVASKLANYSKTKVIEVDGVVSILYGEEETWDFADGVTIVAGPNMNDYNAVMFSIYGKLTVNGGVFDGKADRDKNTSCTFLQANRVPDGQGGNNTGTYQVCDVTLNDCEVKNFGSLPRGTEGYDSFCNDCIFGSGRLTINGGKYHDNLCTNGGVVAVSTYGIINVNGGEFYNNEARYHPAVYCDGGGGVFDVANQVLNVKNAVFHDNTAAQGGVIMSATNTGKDDLCGEAYGVTVTDCTFYNNRAIGGSESYPADGGAIYVANYAAAGLTLHGKNVFHDNTAKRYGGAVYTGNHFSAEDLEVYDNKAEIDGDGIYMAGNNAKFILTPSSSGKINIKDPVYVTPSAGITVCASVAGAESPITVKLPAVTAGRVIATGSGYDLTEDDMAKFTISGSEVELTLDTTKNTIAVAASDEGGGDEGGGQGGGETWEETHDVDTVYLNGASGDNSKDGKTPETAVKTFARASAMLKKDGTIYITGPVSVTGNETWALGGETFGSAKVELHEDIASASASPITVTGSLTLKDITIDGKEITIKKCLVDVNGGQLYLNEGSTIQNYYNSSSNGIIYSHSNGSVTLNGGTIKDCTATGTYSAAIYSATGCTVNVKDGEVSGNNFTGSYSGAIYQSSSTSSRATLDITNLTVKNNNLTGSYGAAIYMGSYGTINIQNCDISGNTMYGAAVSASTSGNITMNDGKITGNTSTNSSGCGLNSTSGNITISGGEISNNTNTYSSGSGGVANTSSGTVTISGGTFTNNTVPSNGGAVSVSAGGSLIISGGTFTGNSAGKIGGAIYTGTSIKEFEITGGTFCDNEAPTCDGIYVNKKEAVTIEPESELDLSDGLYINNTSTAASGAKPVLINDLSKVKGEIPVTLYNSVNDLVIAEPVEGYTIKDDDLAKFTSGAGKLDFSISGENIVVKTTPVTGVSLDQTTLNLMVTEKGTLKATLDPVDATNQRVTWTSSSSSTVAVTGDGLTAQLEAKKIGSAKITVKTADGSKTAECEVTVTENTTPVSNVELSVDEDLMENDVLRLLGGTSTEVTATITPENAANKELEWSVDDEELITITGSGDTVTLTAGTKTGETTVTVTSVDGNHSDSVKVEVYEIPVDSVTISPAAVTVAAGETTPVLASVSPDNASDKTLTWESKDKDIAQVIVSDDTLGISVEGIKAGSTTITATSANGKSATVSVTVTDGSEKSNKMTLDLDKLMLITYQHFNITALFEDHPETVTWSSSDDEVVTIVKTNDRQVTVQGLLDGSATITATSASGQTAQVKVTVSPVKAGNLKDVYVNSYTGSDGNTGASSSQPVASLSKGLSLLGIDGTLHVMSRVDILRDTAISLPYEVYGKAKIQIHGGARLTFQGAYNAYVSDVTIESLSETEKDEYSGRDRVTLGDGFYMPQVGDALYLSEGLTYTGAGRIAYLNEKGNVVINGGTFKDLTYNSSYGMIDLLEGDLAINGGTFDNVVGGTYGGFACANDDANITVNGGTFTGCGSSSSNQGIFAIMDDNTGVITIRGGTFTDCVSYRTNGTNRGAGSFAYVDKHDGLVLDPIYDLEIEGDIYLSDDASSIVALRRLDKVEGSIKLTHYSANNNKLLVTGRDHKLSWTDMDLFTLGNADFSLSLDLTNNRIIMVK